MKEIKLTQGKVALVDDEDYVLNQLGWYFANGYAVRGIRVGSKQRSIYLHRIINNTPEDLHTDHVNHNTLDNRKSNLRTCTNQQNQHNRQSEKNSSSRFKGVSFYKRDNKFQVQISVDGVAKNYGLFVDEEKAALKYNEVALKYHGEFANLNIL